MIRPKGGGNTDPKQGPKDVSPGNILFNAQTGEIKIGDLGLATRVPRARQGFVRPEMLLGTIAYISPEQTGRMNRAIDYRTDLYSMGASIYHLLTGRIPFEGEDLMTIVHGHIAKDPEPPRLLRSDVPEMFGRIVLKLMAKAAEERYQSAEGVAADLERVREAMRSGRDEPFPLAELDAPRVFTIPQKLYGRGPQQAALLEAFDRVAEGDCGLLLVQGPAGIGKSVLVEEVHKPIVERRGTFTSGKYDQFSRHKPLSGLADAVSELLRGVLTAEEEDLAIWRERIGRALGDDAGALVELLGELEPVLGAVAPVEALPAAQARERFDRLMGAFLRVFAEDGRPLVIFLDDLQWVDPGSLRLLIELLEDPGTHHLLIVGAYRDDEVDAAHPLSIAAAALQRIRPQVITLGPLDSSDATALVADSTDRSPADSAPLAALCHQRTGGNPFFLTHFLLGLADDGLLRPSTGREGWVWDLDAIRPRGAAGSAVGLMVDKLQRYSRSCQQLLSLGSCLGATFNLGTLAAVSERSPREVADRVWEPVRDGLVLPLGEAYDLYRGEEFPGDPDSLCFRFAHDRVQEAAWSFIAPDERARVHLTIGRLLSARIPESERAERIFEFVGPLNVGASLLSADERRGLAALNLEAGLRARDSTAYETARRHFAAGVAQLDDDWEGQYDLLSKLHRQRVECIYLSGDTEAALAAFEEVSPRYRTTTQIAELSQVVMRIFQTENRVGEGVQEGLRCLGLLGVGLPADPDAVGARMGELGAGTVAMLGEKGPRALVDGPRLEDPELVAICGVLQQTWICALMASDLPMVAFTTLSVVHISLEHGTSPPSPAGYVAQAALCALQGDYDGARLFGASGLELADARGGQHLRPMVLNTYCNFTGRPPGSDHARDHRGARAHG